MKKLCIIFRHAPHGTPNGREALDLAMLSASFDQQVSLIFTHDGVLNLVANQNPELIGAKDYISTFKALPLYDIDNIYVCQDSLIKFGLKNDSLAIKNAQAVNSDFIKTHLIASDEVLVF